MAFAAVADPEGDRLSRGTIGIDDPAVYAAKATSADRFTDYKRLYMSILRTYTDRYRPILNMINRPNHDLEIVSARSGE